jgi:hypothetical protein
VKGERVEANVIMIMIRCSITTDQILYVINKGMEVEGELRDAILPSGGPPEVQLQQLHKQFRMIPLARQQPCISTSS